MEQHLKNKAVIIAPGRGTYNKDDLGYLRRHHENVSIIKQFDGYRSSLGQSTLTELDGMDRYSFAIHTRGDNASPLIYSCALADFFSIDQQRFDIIGITGNSMGWYTALACAGALDPMGGLRIVNTMGTLMHEEMIGGQLIYPIVDDEWQEVIGRRNSITEKISEINSRSGHDLALSIDLGGMLVIAGNEAGLVAFETDAQPIQNRYPMRLHNHGGFHSKLQEPVSEMGFKRLSKDLFRQPKIRLIDGRGAFWNPKEVDIDCLRNYTLGHQVKETYDFSAAICSAARELMPDVFIVLGPGISLGSSAAQSLIKCGWRGLQSKSDFKKLEASDKLISMGSLEHRLTCV